MVCENALHVSVHSVSDIMVISGSIINTGRPAHACRKNVQLFVYLFTKCTIHVRTYGFFAVDKLRPVTTSYVYTVTHVRTAAVRVYEPTIDVK